MQRHMYVNVEAATAMQKRCQSAKLRRSLLSICVSAACLSSQSARAYEFSTDSGSVTGSLVSTVTAGLGMRTQNPSCSITGDASHCSGGEANTAQWAISQNGDLNYKKNQLFTGYVKGAHELLLKVPEESIKFMARGVWRRDFAAQHTNRTDLSSEAYDQIVSNIELLDLWASKDFSIGEHNGRVKFGNQVISWGEALFTIGGISNNVVDFQRLAVPGTQLKEAFLPIPAIDVSTSLGAGWSAEAFYQFHWRRSRVAPVGSYFSTNNAYGAGRVPSSFGAAASFNGYGPDAYTLTGSRSISDSNAYMASWMNGDLPIGVLSDITPKNSGQYGLALHWAPKDTQVQLGAYVMNYHDQFPVLSMKTNGFGAFPGSYADMQWSFLENRKMYGLSANMPVGNWAVGTELSYRPHDAVSLSGCYGAGGPLDGLTNAAPVTNCPMYQDMQKYQLTVTGMLQLQPSEHKLILDALGANSAFLTLEVSASRYPGASKVITRTIEGVAVQQVAGAGYLLPQEMGPNGYPIGTRLGTDTSWGFVTDFNWTYDGRLISGWQVTPGVTYSRAMKGDTPNFTAQWLEGNQSANFYVLFNENPTRWQAGINYTAYFGGKNDVINRQYNKDRDFLGAFVSYNF